MTDHVGVFTCQPAHRHINRKPRPTVEHDLAAFANSLNEGKRAAYESVAVHARCRPQPRADHDRTAITHSRVRNVTGHCAVDVHAAQAIPGRQLLPRFPSAGARACQRVPSQAVARRARCSRFGAGAARSPPCSGQFPRGARRSCRTGYPYAWRFDRGVRPAGRAAGLCIWASGSY